MLGGAGDGLISAGTYFEELGPAEFVQRAAQVTPNGRCSSFFATAYAGVRVLAGAIVKAGTTKPKSVFRVACETVHDTVLGPVQIDPVTRHAGLHAHIARAEGGRFRIIRSSQAAVAADPYLTGVPASSDVAQPKPNLVKPNLRIVK